jgi:hypothetical protein
MVKKFFSTKEKAQAFARKRNKPDTRLSVTSSVWRQKDKRRLNKRYLIKY